MITKWPSIKSKLISNHRIFDLYEETRQHPQTGKAASFYVLDAPDWVNIIPLTAENKVVMIEQYRFGTDSICLEIPGGMVDPDESPKQAALRELLEETGYQGEDCYSLGSIEPNPAFINNRCHSFVVMNCKQIATPQFDTNELIECKLIDMDTIPELIKSEQIIHSLVAIAFQKYYYMFPKNS